MAKYTTASEFLAFALDFAQQELDTLDPAGWTTLRDTLAMVTGRSYRYGVNTVGGQVQISRHKKWAPEEDTEAGIRTLQESVRILLGTADPSSGEEQRATVMFTGALSLLRKGNQKIVGLQTTGHTIFLGVLLALLSFEPEDRFLHCPMCQTLFLRNRKQQYCTARCKKRANMRTWRKTLRGQEQSRSKARTRYQRKVSKKTPGARVQQRKTRPVIVG